MDLASAAAPGLRVIHADAALLVLEKFAGLLTVPAKPPGPSDCLEARAKAAFPDALLVHRLDRDTSGVIVFARSPLAQRHLGWQFERRQVAKSYVARVWGEMETEAGRIDLPLRADWPNRPRQMVCREHGRAAVTDWRVAAREAGVTRLAIAPLTGRSHQIRAHLAAIGRPILGDALYASPEALAAADRLQLHAERIGLRHPIGGRWVEFVSPSPLGVHA